MCKIYYRPLYLYLKLHIEHKQHNKRFRLFSQLMKIDVKKHIFHQLFPKNLMLTKFLFYYCPNHEVQQDKYMN